jgi:4-alpha-glucanotransferase
MTVTGRRSDEIPPPLARLAERRRVALAYTDAWGRRVETSREALVGVLRALGEPLERAEDAPAALASHAEAPADDQAVGGAPRVRREVIVAWDGLIAPADRARLDSLSDRAAHLVVHGEDGSLANLEPGPVPFGVHTVGPRDAGAPARGGRPVVISAPRRVPAVVDSSWGVFAPTYAIVDERAVPHGDLTSLEKLGRLVAGRGARYLVTLPLLAGGTTPGSPVPRSPYSPISRAFWDEDYLDLQRLPEIASEVSRLDAAVTASSPSATPLLALGAARMKSAGDVRRTAFERYLQARPDAPDYARFLALRDRERTPAGQGEIEAGPAAHLYAQWATDAQLGEVATSVAAAGAGLVLDLPVGCRPDGYDTWAHPTSFGTGATIGAPPDDFFSAGQNWNLAPLHPDGERALGYPVIRAALANLTRHAEVVRIDHVAGWQRLWWIPAGAPAADGAYVSYEMEEMAAVACLAAWRGRCSLVGEDLGTVDPKLRRLLSEHQIAGMDVSVFDLSASPGAPLRPRAGCMAVLDTHDTATVAGWLAADDLTLRHQLGLIDEATLASGNKRRRGDVSTLVGRLRARGRLPMADPAPPTPGSESTTMSDGVPLPDVDPVPLPRPDEVASALLEELGESEASLVIANIEDLWGEPDPQNVPGTVTEHRNFARPMALTLSQIGTDGQVADALTRLDRARQAGGHRRSAASQRDEDVTIGIRGASG